MNIFVITDLGLHTYTGQSVSQTLDIANKNCLCWMLSFIFLSCIGVSKLSTTRATLYILEICRLRKKTKKTQESLLNLSLHQSPSLHEDPHLNLPLHQSHSLRQGPHQNQLFHQSLPYVKSPHQSPSLHQGPQQNQPLHWGPPLISQHQTPTLYRSPC